MIKTNFVFVLYFQISYHFLEGNVSQISEADYQNYLFVDFKTSQLKQNLNIEFESSTNIVIRYIFMSYIYVLQPTTAMSCF